MYTNDPKKRSITVSTFDPISYVFGRTQYFIEVYAAGNGLSPAELTNGLATLLHASQGGTVLGSIDRVSALRRKAAKVHPGSRTVAVDGDAHSRAPGKRKRKVSEESRERMRIAQQARRAAQRDTGKKYKRRMTPERLRSMRANAVKARAALALKRAA